MHLLPQARELQQAPASRVENRAFCNQAGARHAPIEGVQRCTYRRRSEQLERGVEKVLKTPREKDEIIEYLIELRQRFGI